MTVPKIVLINYTFSISLISYRKGNSVINTKSCSVTWWILSFIMIPIALTILIIFVIKMKNEAEKKKKDGYKDDNDPIVWNPSTINSIIIFGFGVGVSSSLLGVGGSFLTVPLLLKFGLSPQKSSSTASFVSMLSSVSSTLQYMIFNLLDYDYAFMTAIGTLLGAI